MIILYEYIFCVIINNMLFTRKLLFLCELILSYMNISCILLKMLFTRKLLFLCEMDTILYEYIFCVIINTMLFTRKLLFLCEMDTILYEYIFCVIINNQTIKRRLYEYIFFYYKLCYSPTTFI